MSKMSAAVTHYGKILASSYKAPSLIKERLLESINLYIFYDALMAFSKPVFDPVKGNYAVGSIFVMQAYMFVNTITNVNMKLTSFMKAQTSLALATMLMLSGTMLYMHYDDEQPNFNNSLPPKVFFGAVSSFSIITVMKLFSDMRTNIARNLAHLILNLGTAFSVMYGLVLNQHKEEVVGAAAYAHLATAGLLLLLPLANPELREGYAQLKDEYTKEDLCDACKPKVK